MYAEINGLKIHYKKSGKGKPILFVHGWGGSLYSLHDLSHLSSSSYCAYVIDLPGFGKSTNPPPRWGVKEYATCVGDFIDTVIGGKTAYFGHSFGGELGIYLAIHRPHAISSLMLCASSFKRSNKITFLARLCKTIPKQIFGLRHVYPFVKRIYYTFLRKQSDLMKFPHLESNFRSIVAYDLSQEIHQIRVKTLILWGEKDTYTPELWAHELARAIPSSVLFVVPNKGHDLPIRYPELIWPKMKTFLISK